MDRRVINDLEFHSVSVIPIERSLDPNCRFIPAKETKMADDQDFDAKGFLSDQELRAVELAVGRAKDMLAPDTYGRLTRALWELQSLRSLTRELFGTAAAAGLIEHERTLRSREAKVSPHQPCA